MFDPVLQSESDEAWSAAMAAKKRLEEIILRPADLDHSEIDTLRAAHFSNLARHREITKIFEAERQADIARRQAKRDARRAEAAAWSKQQLLAATGLTRKDQTRAQLIESYASMAR